MTTTYWCERAALPDGIRDGVLVVVNDQGSIGAVSTAEHAPPWAYRLAGVVLPGFANAHSHAFHRALRGRTHVDGGTFWTWRDKMYALAMRLDPDRYFALARAVYAEMVVAGICLVGEFHYLHHAPDGSRYDDPNAMAEALRQAALDAGVRLSLLDTCYLTGGIDTPLTPEQQRFSDGSVDAWAERVAALRGDESMLVGLAVHSVRAVSRDDLVAIGAADPRRPLHVHLSEQAAENEACLEAYGRTPAELLAETGVLSERTTAVHATHLSTKDIELLGSSGTGVCFCPTTEADLADGIGPARELIDAGCPMSLGTDQNAVVDPLLEARALEHGERLRSGQRGRLRPAELVTTLTSAGHDSLGWTGGGRIAVGAPADLVAIRLDSPRTAGCAPDQLVLAATAADVHAVVSRGRIVARDGRHEQLGDVGRLLSEAIEGLLA
ncbi:MAG TPA: formimidoylglutamate deiminase [Actinophytocola sp.]|uniref:formimidoylglutamate deiminase n=1 Tax=Actinophytocola sp. TaxID=1872138 RepID=UPI002DDDAFB5|nr:formimidoylglutamate deiminase [Actinophytocola sp.]HEV2779955.1 formimidoylglutamate deiminase [Actinophytocola sp.]